MFLFLSSSDAPDKLNGDSLSWALTHIQRYGDTDLFPVPFEYEVIKAYWTPLLPSLSEFDLANYELSPAIKLMLPKSSTGYREAQSTGSSSVVCDPILTCRGQQTSALGAESISLETNPSHPSHTTEPDPVVRILPTAKKGEPFQNQSSTRLLLEGAAANCDEPSWLISNVGPRNRRLTVCDPRTS